MFNKLASFIMPTKEKKAASPAQPDEKVKSLPPINLVLLGDPVSKHRLRLRLDKGYSPIHLGIDFTHIKVKQGSMEQSVNICDRGGQEKFRSLRKTGNINAIIICFDSEEHTESRSLEDLNMWIRNAQDCYKNTPIIIVETRADSITRTITAKKASDFALENNVYYAECSIKTQENIKTLLDAAIMLANQQISGKCQLPKQETVNLTPKPVQGVAPVAISEYSALARAAQPAIPRAMPAAPGIGVAVAATPPPEEVTARIEAAAVAVPRTMPTSPEMCAPGGPIIPKRLPEEVFAPGGPRIPRSPR